MWTVWRSWCEGPEHRKDVAARGRAPDERGGSCWPRGAPSARTWHRAVRVTALATPVLAITTRGPCATRRRHLPFSFCSHGSGRSPFPFRAAEPRRLEKRGEGAALKCPGRRHLARRPHEAGCGSLSARRPRPPSQVRSMSSVGSRHDMRTATAAGQGPQLSASVSWTPGTSRRVPCGGGNAADVLTAPPGKRQRRPTPRGICPRDRGGPGAPPSASAGWGPRQPGRESRSSLPPPFCPKNLPVKTCLSASLLTETRHRTL